MNQQLERRLSRLAGPTGQVLLQDLYSRLVDYDKGVDAKRFRADHRDYRDEIRRLESRSLIQNRFEETEVYRPLLLALTLIKEESSRRLLATADLILRYLSERYIESPNCNVTRGEIVASVEATSADTCTALRYLKETPAVSGGSVKFPATDDSFTLAGEQLLDFDSLEPLILQLAEWADRSPVLPLAPFVEEAVSQKTGLSSLFDSDLVGHWTSSLPDGIKLVLLEVDHACQSGLEILPAFGIRTIIEMSCAEKIEDTGSLPSNIEALVRKGLLTSASGKALRAVVELGNASAHRGYQPQPEDLAFAIDVTCDLLRELYHISSRADALRRRVPKRKHRK